MFKRKKKERERQLATCVYLVFLATLPSTIHSSFSFLSILSPNFIFQNQIVSHRNGESF